MRPDPQPLSALPRRQMLLVGLGVFAVSSMSHFRTPLLPEMGAELLMSTGQLGLVTTVFAAGRLVTDLPAGFLVDRLGARRVFVFAGVALLAGGGVFTTAQTPWWILIAAAMLGVASALANTTGMTYFSSVASVERRGRSMAVFSASLLGGQAIGPALGGAIAGLGTWRTAMLVSAILGGTLAVFGALSRAFGWLVTRGSPHDVPGGQVGQTLSPPQRVALYAIPFSTMFMMGSLPQTLVPIIGGSSLGLSSATIGLALGLAGVCRMIGSPTGGWLSDRISRKAVLIPALFCQAAGVAILAVATTVPLWLLSIVLMSLFSFGGAVAATMLADLAGSAKMGRRLGSYRFVGDAGLIVGPVLTALVFERVGQAQAVLMVAGLLVSAAVLAAVVLPETRWQEQGAS